MTRLSASKLPLARRCLYWARDDVPLDQRTESRHSAAGTATHALIAGECEPADVGERFGLSEDDADRAVRVCEAWRQSALSRLLWEYEVPFAWHPSNGARRLPKGEHRDYGDLQPGEIPGTADAVCVVNDRVFVADFKAGFRPVDPARDNAQLRFLCMTAATEAGKHTAEGAILRVTEDGPLVDAATFDLFDLAGVEEDMEGVLRAVDGAQPQTGAHCRDLYCPALTSCPETQRAIVQAAPADPTPHEVSAHIQSPEHAAWLLHRLSAVRKACDTVDAALRAYADENGGIPLDDGKIWRRRDQERTSIALDGPQSAEAMAVLREFACHSAVKQTTSMAAIERALRALGLKGAGLKEAMASIRSALAQAGALRSKSVATYSAGK